MEAVFDVPLTERYPWAESLDKVPQEKKDLEEEDPMEPLFGSITGTQVPPTGRSQNYIERRGWMQRKAYPPWLNRPLVGTEIFVPNKMRWKKDRRPRLWQLKGRYDKSRGPNTPYRKRRRELGLDKDEEAFEDGDMAMDEMDAELDQLSAG